VKFVQKSIDISVLTLHKTLLADWL